MKNKYLRRGVILMAIGAVFLSIGINIMEEHNGMLYGWAMIGGVVFFGIGFLSFVYSLIRKVERKAILDERAADQEEAEEAKSEDDPKPAADADGKEA